MLKKKIAMILALSTLLASMGTINVSAEETIGTSNDNSKPSVIDLLYLKRYFLNGNTEYLPQYDYNQDNIINGIDMLSLKKYILGIPNIIDTFTMTKIQEIDGLDESMKDNILDFSMDFFKQQLQQDENTIVSPQSLYFALGMTINGAKGNTQQEIKNALCKDVSIADFNNNVAYLISETDTDTCKIANSIWVRDAEGLSLNEDFQNYSQEYFNSEVFKQPFDDLLVSDVNDWVNKNTDGMIPTVLNHAPSDDVLMYLINAICFEADWDTEYEPSEILEDRTFTNSMGEKQTVTMLSSNEDIYISDDDATGFLKYYDGQRYAFMGILPNEDVSVEEYVNNLTGEKFSYLYNNRKTTDENNISLSVLIPEFTSEGTYNLNKTLQNMGIQTAFTDNADFSNMLNVPNKINSVLQKAYIKVDRNGTEASAVTIITDNATCVPIEKEYLDVYLNRPFIYAIVDTETELPIFMGVINSVDSPEE